MKECPSYGVYFLVYEESKRLAEAHLGWHAVPTTIASGGLAGCVSLSIVHPFDVVKSRVQALPLDASPAERSVFQVASKGFAREGASFFKRGFAAAMQRAFVVNAGIFGGYELACAALAAR